MARTNSGSESLGWAWSAVIAGVIASLVVQILLALLGFGIGLLSIDVPTASSSPQAISWTAFAWWAASGIVAAFIGGIVAGSAAPSARGSAALAAWALAIVIVVAAAGLTAGTTATVATSLGGPTMAASERIDLLVRGAQGRTTTGQVASSTVGSGGNQSQLEEARRNFAMLALASFVALLLGAGAALLGGQWSRQFTSQRA